MRLFASLGHYIATRDAAGLQIHQYVPARIAVEFAPGRAVAVRMEAAYPWDGRIRLTVEQGTGAPWALRIRVPAWCDGAVRTRVNGTAVTAATEANGYVLLERAWSDGDVVEVELPMESRLIEAPTYQFALLDRDAIYSPWLAVAETGMGVRALWTRVLVPTANPVCKRLLGSLRRERLDFLISLGEEHLRRILRSWAVDCNGDHPYASLRPGLLAPHQDFPHPRSPAVGSRETHGAWRDRFSAGSIMSAASRRWWRNGAKVIAEDRRRNWTPRCCWPALPRARRPRPKT